MVPFTDHAGMEFFSYREVEIEILHPQFHAFEETKPAAVQQFDRKIVGMLQMFQDGVYFLSGKDNCENRDSAHLENRENRDSAHL